MKSRVRISQGRGEYDGQITPYWQRVGFPINIGMLVNRLGRGREVLIFIIVQFLWFKT